MLAVGASLSSTHTKRPVEKSNSNEPETLYQNLKHRILTLACICLVTPAIAPTVGASGRHCDGPVELEHEQSATKREEENSIALHLIEASLL
jgi:hypothetical protein